MVDEGGERIVGRKVGQGPGSGLIPTGDEAVWEGESVTTEEDIASGYIPDTDEILLMAEEHCAGHHPDEELPPEPERQEPPKAPHDTAPPMADIE